MSPCPCITPKSQIEQKGAPKHHGITTGSRSDPNPRELKTSVSPKASNPGINRVRDTKIAGALPPDLPDFSSSAL
jgi:hypothetical protein